MLVNLPPIQSEIDRCKKVANDNNFDYVPQSDPQWIQDTGIYQCNMGLTFPENEFEETQSRLSFDELYNCVSPKSTHGVSDNIEQIKQYYKDEVEDKDRKFFIYLTPIFQDKNNAGNYDGWRWHKWGKYIGDLNPQRQYLDDEDFGDDFKYVIVFTIQMIKDK